MDKIYNMGAVVGVFPSPVSLTFSLYIMKACFYSQDQQIYTGEVCLSPSEKGINLCGRYYLRRDGTTTNAKTGQKRFFN